MILGQRPQLEVEFSPIEPVWLEILVSFHAIRRFAQFVEIADSVAVAIGIKNPPHGFDHDEDLIDGKGRTPSKRMSNFQSAVKSYL